MSARLLLLTAGAPLTDSSQTVSDAVSILDYYLLDLERPDAVDVVGATDSAIVSQTSVRDTDNSVGVTDDITVSVYVDHVVVVADTIGVQDDTTGLTFIERNISDNIGTVDSRTTVLAIQRAISDSIHVVDASHVQRSGDGEPVLSSGDLLVVILRTNPPILTDPGISIEPVSIEPDPWPIVEERQLVLLTGTQ